MNSNKTQSLNLKYLAAMAAVAVLSISAAGITALPVHAAGLATSTVGTSTISGTVFTDANHDKVQDNGESGLAGILVWLHLGKHKNSTVVATTTTDSFGHYVFNNLASGTYFVGQKVKGFFHFGHAKQAQKVTLTATTTAATVNFAEASSTKKHISNEINEDKRRIASSTKMLNIKADLKAFLGDDHDNHKGSDN